MCLKWLLDVELVLDIDFLFVPTNELKLILKSKKPKNL